MTRPVWNYPTYYSPWVAQKSNRIIMGRENFYTKTPLFIVSRNLINRKRICFSPLSYIIESKVWDFRKPIINHKLDFDIFSLSSHLLKTRKYARTWSRHLKFTCCSSRTLIWFSLGSWPINFSYFKTFSHDTKIMFICLPGISHGTSSSEPLELLSGLTVWGTPILATTRL